MSGSVILGYMFFVDLIFQSFGTGGACPASKDGRSPLIPPWFERASVTDGLASGFVRGLLQDRQGFL